MSETLSVQEVIRVQDKAIARKGGERGVKGQEKMWIVNTTVI